MRTSSRARALVNVAVGDSAEKASKKVISTASSKPLKRKFEEEPQDGLDTSNLSPTSTSSKKRKSVCFASASVAEIPNVVEQKIIPNVVKIESNKKSNKLNSAVETLPVPDSVPLLQKFFNALDDTISLMIHRKLKCTFRSLKPQVEQLCKRKFTTTHLARILTIFPNAYTVDRVLVSQTQYENCFDIVLKPVTIIYGTSVLRIRSAQFLDGRKQEFNRRYSEFLSSESSEGDEACIPKAMLPNLMEHKKPNLINSLSDKSESSKMIIPEKEHQKENKKYIPPKEVVKNDLESLSIALRTSFRYQSKTRMYLDEAATDIASTWPSKISRKVILIRLIQLTVEVPEWCSIESEMLTRPILILNTSANYDEVLKKLRENVI